MHAPLHLDPEALPCSLAWSQPVTDEQLEALSAANDEFQFERTRHGAIRLNPPTELTTSSGNAEIIHQLQAWWKTHRRGRVADSNGWLVDPYRRQVLVYYPGAPPAAVSGDSIQGSGPVEGFVLDLS